MSDKSATEYVALYVHVSSIKWTQSFTTTPSEMFQKFQFVKVVDVTGFLEHICFLHSTPVTPKLDCDFKRLLNSDLLNSVSTTVEIRGGGVHKGGTGTPNIR